MEKCIFLKKFFDSKIHTHLSLTHAMHKKTIVYENLNNCLFLPLWFYIRIPISEIPILNIKHLITKCKILIKVKLKFQSLTIGGSREGQEGSIAPPPRKIETLS